MARSINILTMTEFVQDQCDPAGFKLIIELWAQA